MKKTLPGVVVIMLAIFIFAGCMSHAPKKTMRAPTGLFVSKVSERSMHAFFKQLKQGLNRNETIDKAIRYYPYDKWNYGDHRTMHVEGWENVELHWKWKGKVPPLTGEWETHYLTVFFKNNSLVNAIYTIESPGHNIKEEFILQIPPSKRTDPEQKPVF